MLFEDVVYLLSVCCFLFFQNPSPRAVAGVVFSSFLSASGSLYKIKLLLEMDCSLLFSFEMRSRTPGDLCNETAPC